ncbi:ROK family transcriptional regulator [Amycolatopsis sp. NBC_01488]|uniref:ROK family transcriptional regulator n=1 Tax=Amycolatopsis sp. NBC_01488 TaxID=2903563 RepID=UPI002E282E2C|nr:ROK family transcriptional regulator [Amycolatopsis sp. NBC_01488]
MITKPGRPGLLRTINDKAAFELLLARGALSRAQLVELTGLTHPTVTQVIGRLEASGLVLPAGVDGAGERGPNARLFVANPRSVHVAGVSVTPWRTAVAIVDATGVSVAEREVPAGSLTRLRPTIEAAAAQAGLRVADLHQVVIATPGAIHPRTGELGFAPHMTGWHLPDLPASLTAALGIDVALENDVNAAAIAEMRIGHAQGVDSFVLLWVSDGLGMAVVVDGRIRHGANGAAGEVSYLPVPGAPLSRDVGRGGHGGFQLTAGAAAVLELARAHGVGGESAAEAVGRAGPGPFLAELATRLATGLASVVSVLDPELIVLAGDVAEAGGGALLELIGADLAEIAVSRPRLELSAVPGDAVRTGALHAALAMAKSKLFPL